MQLARAMGATAAVACFLATAAVPAHAGDRDRDGDGIPNRWEQAHGMNPLRAADAKADFDRDGLTNLREYRLGTKIRNADTDSDGYDDGDEVKDGFRSTHVVNADTDGDGLLDGDEDADRDGVDNEDEDDALERCRFDDADRDGDHVADEDENELGLVVGESDSDGDGAEDGEEDADRDGEANEDEDDDDLDTCDGDYDGDGEADEDDDDRLGAIVSYDNTTATLTVDSYNLGTVSFTLTEDTEIKAKDSNGPDGSDDEHLTTADLQPGLIVAELEVDDDAEEEGEVEFDISLGVLKEIKIYLP